jgi:trans-2,3-dihydro-3-hydroxyanthranilate isomerase
MRLPFRLVDVFTERPLAGNQLCVVPETPAQMDAGLMQAVAAEIGFSETTFVLEASLDRYRMRIFTPGTELPFAGHPTLGTAFVLVSEGGVRSPAVQTVPAGDVPVEVDVAVGFAWMQQLPAEFGLEFPHPEAAVSATGLGVDDLEPDLPPKVVSTGLRHLLVGVRNADRVAGARPDQAAVNEVLKQAGADGLYLFAVADGGAKARFFGSGVGVAEDPATGSAAGPLGAYLAERGVVPASQSLVVRQGEEVSRPSELHVVPEREGSKWRVRVGGGVQVVGRGEFDLQDRFFDLRGQG